MKRNIVVRMLIALVCLSVWPAMAEADVVSYAWDKGTVLSFHIPMVIG